MANRDVGKNIIGKTVDSGKNIVNRRSGRTFIFNQRDPDKLNLNIETWADVDTRTFMCWGDYWVKQKLLSAFTDIGVNVTVHPTVADVTVYLWGSPFPERGSYPFFYNPKSFNVAWFYSNPDKMSKEELERYDLVFCLSEIYLKIINGWSNNIYPDPLLSCTDFSVPKGILKNDIDILFVGNARGGMDVGRKAVSWLDPPEKSVVMIYGHKWTKHRYVDKWYAGKYWPYQELNELYNRSKITIVDGHSDMNRYGFVQMKIYDTLASGGFVISAFNTGVSKIFGDSVPMFRNADEMNMLIKYYLENVDERKNKIREGSAIASRERYSDRAKKILEVLTEKMELK